MAFWKTEVQCHIQKGSPIISILTRMNPISRIDIYVFKTLSNIVLPSTHGPSSRSHPCRLPINILKALVFSGYMTCPSQSSRLNHPDYNRFSNILSLLSYLSASHPHSETSNILVIVLYILFPNYFRVVEKTKLFGLNNNIILLL
jgi:hypothetical protein